MPSRSSTFGRFHLFSRSSTSVNEIERHATIHQKTPSISAYQIPPNGEIDLNELVVSLDSISKGKYPPCAWENNNSKHDVRTSVVEISHTITNKANKERSKTKQKEIINNDHGFIGGHNYKTMQVEERRRLVSLGLAQPKPPAASQSDAASASPVVIQGKRRSSWQPPQNGKLQKSKSKHRESTVVVQSSAPEPAPIHTFSRIHKSPPTPQNDFEIQRLKGQSPTKDTVSDYSNVTQLVEAWRSSIDLGCRSPVVEAGAPSLGALAVYHATREYQNKCTDISPGLPLESNRYASQTSDGVHRKEVSTPSQSVQTDTPASQQERGRSRHSGKREEDKKHITFSPAIKQSMQPTEISPRVASTIMLRPPGNFRVHQRNLSSDDIVKDPITGRLVYPKTPPPNTLEQVNLPPLPKLAAPVGRPESSNESPVLRKALAVQANSTHDILSPLWLQHKKSPPSLTLQTVQGVDALDDFAVSPISIEIPSITDELPPPIPFKDPGRGSRESSRARYTTAPPTPDTERSLVPEPSMLQVVSQLQRVDSIGESEYYAPLHSASYMKDVQIAKRKNPDWHKTGRKSPRDRAHEDVTVHRVPFSQDNKSKTNQRSILHDTNDQDITTSSCLYHGDLSKSSKNGSSLRSQSALDYVPAFISGDIMQSPVATEDKRSQVEDSVGMSTTILDRRRRFSTQSWDITPTKFIAPLHPLKAEEKVKENLVPPHERPDWQIVPEPLSISKIPFDTPLPNFVPNPPFSASRHARGQLYNIPALNIQPVFPSHNASSSEGTRSISTVSANSSKTSLSSVVPAPLSISPAKSSTETSRKHKQKLFAVCCQCDLFHDMHPALHQTLMEQEEEYHCSSCRHQMTIRCCQRWATVVKFENQLL